MKIATVIGFLAIVMWGASATLLMQLKTLPPFQIMFVTYGIAASVLLCRTTALHRWHKLKQSPAAHCLGMIGIFGTSAFYIFALKLAPPAIVVLISYCWPILTILFVLINPADQFRWFYCLSGFLAYAGIHIIVLEQPSNLTSLSEWGYVLALLSAVCWAAYSYTAHLFKQYSSDGIGLYCLIGFVLSCFLHLTTEVTATPSTIQWIVLVSMGLTVSGPAFLLWEHGIKHGHRELLFIGSYTTPVLSNALLVTIGESQGTPRLILATGLVILAAYTYLMLSQSSVKVEQKH